MSQCTRGFNSSQARDAREIRFQNEKDDRIISLQKENVLMRRIADDYKTKYQNTMNELHQFQKANATVHNLLKSYPYLYKHLAVLNFKDDDDDFLKIGIRFDEEMIPNYILLGVSGEYFTNLLHNFLGFPSMRNCRYLKKKI